MPAAIVVGAATPFGREVCAELSSQNIATIAVVHDEPARKDFWAERIRYNRVRVDVIPATPMAISSLVVRMMPTHVVSVLAATLGRAALLRAQGIPAGNYEEGNFKVTSLFVDAVIQAQLPAHIAYLSSVRVAAGGADPALAAIAQAEQKLQLCTLSYTIVRAPPLLEHGSGAGQLPFKLWALAQRGAYGALGALGLRELAAVRRPADLRQVARALVDAAFCEGAASSVLGPRQLGL